MGIINVVYWYWYFYLSLQPLTYTFDIDITSNTKVEDEISWISRSKSLRVTSDNDRTQYVKKQELTNRIRNILQIVVRIGGRRVIYGHLEGGGSTLLLFLEISNVLKETPRFLGDQLFVIHCM